MRWYHDLARCFGRRLAACGASAGDGTGGGGTGGAGGGTSVTLEAAVLDAAAALAGSRGRW
jgi:hypothetical protein